MNQATLSSLGKMQIHLAEAALIGLFIDKNSDDFDFILLFGAIALTIGGVVFTTKSAKLRKNEEQEKELRLSTGIASKRTIKFPRNTTFIVEESKD